ncbi:MULTISPECIES: hypothetical protein [Roseateles]|uniref:HupE / UreJ protein n=1 Tax=Pelomonas caseinilytica TaxID=2906763 RepID=A0ABS8X5U5_9BURK|nr:MULTISPECIES: hypothetical protein [unclassified Roseateles]MCE4535699.1 hypothetical protein [Pelomonas sp. P7]HEV6966356.1 hypothetical protein [Roseateles sp.]
MRTMLLLLPLIACASALAHDGHGAPALHLHGWDGTALSALAAVAGLALWWLVKGRK